MFNLTPVSEYLTRPLRSIAEICRLPTSQCSGCALRSVCATHETEREREAMAFAAE